MTKPKNPLFGFNVRGTLANALTFRRRGQETIAEEKPIPKDAKTSAQLAWRTMYQLATGLWNALSAAEKATWERLARRHHMTGYAWFMSQALKPNPGIYLPLAGGTMQGDINTDGHKITGLPVPAAGTEAANKDYVDGAGGGDYFALTRYLLSSRYHVFPIGGNSAITLVANKLYAVPYFTPVARTITKMAIQVTGTAAGNARIGIYQDNGSIYPGALVADAGAISTSTLGLKEIAGLNISLLPNTLYWMVCVSNAGAIIAAVSYHYAWQLLGYGATLNLDGSSLWYVAFVYAVLPATFPVGATAQDAISPPKIAIYF